MTQRSSASKTASSDPKQKALAEIEGLEIGDVLKFFYAKASDRDKQIAALVDTDDELECDGAITSDGEDNGAFVLTWTWVSFSGTALDKECQCGEPTAKAIEMRSGEIECLCANCLEEATCPGCGAVEGTEAYGTVGDGFDGYCPSCADKREPGETGEVDPVDLAEGGDGKVFR